MKSLLSCLCIGFCALAHGQRSLINDRKISVKSSGCGQSPSISTGKSTSMSGTFDGTKRTWRVYLPSTYNKNTPCVLFRVISIINLPHIPSNGLPNKMFALLAIQHCARRFNSWLGWQVRCNSFCCFLLFFVVHRCNFVHPRPFRVHNYSGSQDESSSGISTASANGGNFIAVYPDGYADNSNWGFWGSWNCVG